MRMDPFAGPGNGYGGERTDVRRTKDGRPYVYDFEKGKEAAFTRVSTFIDCLEDKSLLARWGERMTLLGLKQEKDLRSRLMKVDVETLDDKELRNTLNALVSEAKEVAGTRDAAHLGTDLHGLAETLDRGEELPDVPEELADDIEVYRKTIERYRLRPVDIERFVVLDDLRAAGTLDRIYEWQPNPDADPIRVVGDVKTGRIDYGQGKLAMQLAMYSRGAGYDPSKPQERVDTEVDQDVGLIIHLPAGQGFARVYRVDLNIGWQGVLLAQQVRAFRALSARGLLEDIGLEFDLEDTLSAMEG